MIYINPIQDGPFWGCSQMGREGGGNFGTKFLNLLAFLKSLKTFLINMVKILIISANLATPGLLKTYI